MSSQLSREEYDTPITWVVSQFVSTQCKEEQLGECLMKLQSSTLPIYSNLPLSLSRIHITLPPSISHLTSLPPSLFLSLSLSPSLPLSASISHLSVSLPSSLSPSIFCTLSPSHHLLFLTSLIFFLYLSVYYSPTLFFYPYHLIPSFFITLSLSIDLSLSLFHFIYPTLPIPHLFSSFSLPPFVPIISPPLPPTHHPSIYIFL
jgi:hypothetical protein